MLLRQRRRRALPAAGRGRATAVPAAIAVALVLAALQGVVLGQDDESSTNLSSSNDSSSASSPEPAAAGSSLKNGLEQLLGASADTAEAGADTEDDDGSGVIAGAFVKVGKLTHLSYHKSREECEAGVSDQGPSVYEGLLDLENCSACSAWKLYVDKPGFRSFTVCYSPLGDYLYWEVFKHKVCEEPLDTLSKGGQPYVNWTEGKRYKLNDCARLYGNQGNDTFWDTELYVKFSIVNGQYSGASIDATPRRSHFLAPLVFAAAAVAAVVARAEWV